MLSTIESDLTAHVGGEPTAAERLLIQAASVKAVRLALLADQLLDGAEIQSDQHNVLAWANSLRHDLLAIGLERRAKQVCDSASDLVRHFDRPFVPEAVPA